MGESLTWTPGYTPVVPPAEINPDALHLFERYTEVSPDLGLRPVPVPVPVPLPEPTQPQPTPVLGAAFERAHTFVMGHEGGLSLIPEDPGNWSGGRVGAGELRGTNFGISAASYPDIDIRSLTREQARALYKRDYWNRIRGDDLPPELALLAYDYSVNAGVSRAAKSLQKVVGVTQDGVIGPATLAAVARFNGRGAELCAQYLAARLVFHTSLPTWGRFGAGWARRICSLPFQAMQMED